MIKLRNLRNKTGFLFYDIIVIGDNMKLYLQNRIRASHIDELYKTLDSELAFIKLALTFYETLNDEEKYELITHFFDVRLDTKDLLDLINLKLLLQ